MLKNITVVAPNATTGLSPTVTVYSVPSGALAYSASPMGEIGGGIYNASVDLDGETEYAFVVDLGSAFTSTSRYPGGRIDKTFTAQEVWEYDVKQSTSSTAGDKLNKLPVGVGILGQQGKTKFELEKEKELLDAVKKIVDDVEELKKKETVIEREIELPDISSPIVQKMEEIGRKMREEMKVEVNSAVDTAVAATIERDEQERLDDEAETVVNTINVEIVSRDPETFAEEAAEAVEDAVEDAILEAIAESIAEDSEKDILKK